MLTLRRYCDGGGEGRDWGNTRGANCFNLVHTVPLSNLAVFIPPQLEKNHVVPNSSQEEALARHGVSREVPCSALKGETVPDSPQRKQGNQANIWGAESLF